MFNLELILQIFIILVCSVVIFLQFPFNSSNAQITCNGQPPLRPTPERLAWSQFTTVSVVIFDTPNPTDFNLLSIGIRYWNDIRFENCSNVFFEEAVPATDQDQNQEPPDNTIWVTRPPTPNGQLKASFSNRGLPNQRVRAAKMLIRNTFTYRETFPHEIDSLAAHEIGHSFGLDNAAAGTPFGVTIMGGTFGKAVIAAVTRRLSLMSRVTDLT